MTEFYEYEFIVEDDDDFPLVCANGCPEGYLGKHKSSCELAMLPDDETEEEDM